MIVKRNFVINKIDRQIDRQYSMYTYIFFYIFYIPVFYSLQIIKQTYMKFMKKILQYPQSIPHYQVSRIPHQQKDSTCYANAIATAIRATQRRMGKFLDKHSNIVNELVKKHGKNGANTYQVLKEQCKKRNLRCRKIDYFQCGKALQKERVVIASFSLDQFQWKCFQNFFKKYPHGVLQKQDIAEPFYPGRGHAVVIVSQKLDYWVIKNSWGWQFGQCGYFRVAKNALDFEYIDVYFPEQDLIKQEKQKIRIFSNFRLRRFN